MFSCDQIQTLRDAHSQNFGVLYYDEGQIQKMDDICKTILAKCPPNKLPALAISIFARQKYTQKYRDRFGDVELPYSGLFRKVVYTKNLVRAVKSMEISSPYTIDSFKIPQHTLVLYLDLNPKSQIEVLNDLHHSMVSNLVHEHKEKEDFSFTDEFTTMLLSSKRPLVKHFDIDIDTKNNLVLRDFYVACPYLLDNVFFIVETNGGFHLVMKEGTNMQSFFMVLKRDKQLEKPYFHEDSVDCNGKPIPKKAMIEILSDVRIPIPGTVQGNFPVRFVSLDEFKELIQ